MSDQQDFHFKAATGFGAVVDGTVASTSAEQVERDLLRQGLIPVRIWSEEISGQQNFLSRIGVFFRQLASRRRSRHSGAI